MRKTIEAEFVDGILKPKEPLSWLPERSRVRVTIETETVARPPWSDIVGILPDEDAAEMLAIIRGEFGNSVARQR